MTITKEEFDAVRVLVLAQLFSLMIGLGAYLDGISWPGIVFYSLAFPWGFMIIFFVATLIVQISYSLFMWTLQLFVRVEDGQ